MSFVSLAGIKDIVLESTGQPMPLLHVQFGLSPGSAEARPRPGHDHMFCTPAGDALDEACGAHGHTPMATATVVSTGATRTDWTFVLTSEI